MRCYGALAAPFLYPQENSVYELRGPQQIG